MLFQTGLLVRKVFVCSRCFAQRLFMLSFMFERRDMNSTFTASACNLILSANVGMALKILYIVCRKRILFELY